MHLPSFSRSPSLSLSLSHDDSSIHLFPSFPGSFFHPSLRRPPHNVRCPIAYFSQVPRGASCVSLCVEIIFKSAQGFTLQSVWLTTVFVNWVCQGDLLNSAASCCLYPLFCLWTNTCRLPGCLRWLPEWVLNCNERLLTYLTGEERRGKKGEKVAGGKERKARTQSNFQFSTQLS